MGCPVIGHFTQYSYLTTKKSNVSMVYLVELLPSQTDAKKGHLKLGSAPVERLSC